MKDISQVREAIDNYKNKFEDIEDNKLLACVAVSIAEGLGFEFTDDMSIDDIARIELLKRVILEAIAHNCVLYSVLEQVEFLLFDFDEEE